MKIPRKYNLKVNGKTIKTYEYPIKMTILFDEAIFDLVDLAERGKIRMRDDKIILDNGVGSEWKLSTVKHISGTMDDFYWS